MVTKCGPKHPEFTNACLVRLLDVPPGYEFSLHELQEFLEKRGLKFPSPAKNRNHQKLQWKAIVEASLRLGVFVRSKKTTEIIIRNRKRPANLYIRTSLKVLKLPERALKEAIEYENKAQAA